MVAHPGCGHIGQILPADRHAALRRRVEPAQHQQEATLAGAGAAQNAEARPGGNGEGHVGKHVRPRLIAERNMVEDDIAVHGQLLRVRPVLLAGGVENFTDTGHGNARLAHLGDHAAQTAHGGNAHGVIDGEGDELALGHFAAHAQNAADQHDEHRLDAGRRVADGPEVRKRAAQAHPERGIVLILLFKALPLVFLAAKGAHYAHAGQILLRDGGQHALGFVAGGVALPDGVVEQQRIDDDDREHDRRHERQLPVHKRHAHERKHDHCHSAEHGDELLFKEGLDTLNVRGAALDDIAGGVLHMPLPRQVLDVVVQQVPAGLDECFARLGAVDIHAVAHDGREKPKSRHKNRRDPEVLPQIRRAAERFDDRPRRRGLHRGLPDQGVDAHADDLRNDQLTKRKEQACGNAGGKIPPAAVQQPRKRPPVGAFFLLFQGSRLAFFRRQAEGGIGNANSALVAANNISGITIPYLFRNVNRDYAMPVRS